MKRTAGSVLILSSLVAGAGCAPGGTSVSPGVDGSKAPAPPRSYSTPKAVAPVRLTAKAVGHAAPGEKIRLHLEAVPEIGVDSLELHWILPEGWTVASGATVWEGPVEAGEKRELDCEVTLPEMAAGEAMAKAVLKGADGAVLTRIASVSVGSAKAAPKPSLLRETVTPQGERLIESQGTPRR